MSPLNNPPFNRLGKRLALLGLRGPAERLSFPLSGPHFEACSQKSHAAVFETLNGREKNRPKGAVSLIGRSASLARPNHLSRNRGSAKLTVDITASNICDPRALLYNGWQWLHAPRIRLSGAGG